MKTHNSIEKTKGLDPHIQKNLLPEHPERPLVSKTTEIHPEPIRNRAQSMKNYPQTLPRPSKTIPQTIKNHPQTIRNQPDHGNHSQNS